MAVNRDKPDHWKADIARSVDMYNNWFVTFAPEAYQRTRIQIAIDVEATLRATNNLRDVSVALLKSKPAMLPSLRMSTCPPLAVDRLIGLTQVSRHLVYTMEKQERLPPKIPHDLLVQELRKIGTIIERMADPDVFVWLARGDAPSDRELYRATTIVADRLTGTVTNPLIRNAQEQRQLAALGNWLTSSGYQHSPIGESKRHDELSPGTYSFRLNVPVMQEQSSRTINMPVDALVMPMDANTYDLPLLIEAKSAGDFANVNKRRKEEATKIHQLRRTYGQNVRYVLLLGGYFDSGYLGYAAAEGIDWVWEHRIDDLAAFGL